MNKLFLISLLLFPTLIHAGQLSIGDPLPSSAKALEYKIMISPSQVSSAYAVLEDGITFIVSVDHDGNLNYIKTNDPQFKTSEKLKVGETLRKAKNYQVGTVNKESGWCFWILLSSSWKAAFIQGLSATEGKLKPDSAIKWFFKR
jgi:DNA-binding transcriptional regulator YhcF (GntR family)